MAGKTMKKGYVERVGPKTPEMDSTTAQMRTQQAAKLEEETKEPEAAPAEAAPTENVPEAVPPEVPKDIEMPDELSVLVGRVTVGKNTWKDCKGVKHPILPLDFADLASFTNLHGDFREAFDAKEEQQIELMITLIWLSVRKEDLTEQELDEEKWKYSRSATGRMFRLNDGPAIAQLGMGVMRLSGLDVTTEDDEGGNVEEAGAEE